MTSTARQTRPNNRPVGISSVDPNTVFVLKPTVVSDAETLLPIFAQPSAEDLQNSDRPNRRTANATLLSAKECSITLEEVMGHARRTARVRVQSIDDVETPPQLKLFAKFFPPRQVDHIRREIIGYRALKSLQGSTIPFCYGTFQCAQYDGIIVLLEDTSLLGVPLHLFEGEKTAAQFHDASLALKSIHALDIAHSDSSHGNILIAETGVIIIDFERAKWKPLPNAFRSDGNLLYTSFIKYGWPKATLAPTKKRLWKTSDQTAE